MIDVDKTFDYKKRIQDGLGTIIKTAEAAQEKKDLRQYESIIRIAKAQLKNLDEFLKRHSEL